MICEKCSAVLQMGSPFCGSCGAAASQYPPMDQQPYPAMNDQPYAWQAAAPKKVNMIYVAGAIVGAVLLVFAVSMLIFSLNPDPSNLAELNRANSPEQTDP